MKHTEDSYTGSIVSSKCEKCKAYYNFHAEKCVCERMKAAQEEHIRDYPIYEQAEARKNAKEGFNYARKKRKFDDIRERR